jgi:hypothetical protein
VYTIEYAGTVVEDLATLRAYDRKHLLDRIEAQLTACADGCDAKPEKAGGFGAALGTPRTRLGVTGR